MKSVRSVTDGLAIGLSVLCAIHCLALPLVLGLLPSLMALPLQSEAFHFWMVIVVIPTSLYALTLGCKRHKRYQVVGLGIAGLSCLLLALALEHSLGEVGEKVLTLAGAALISLGHYFNYRLCQQHNDCACPEHQAD